MVQFIWTDTKVLPLSGAQAITPCQVPVMNDLMTDQQRSAKTLRGMPFDWPVSSLSDTRTRRSRGGRDHSCMSTNIHPSCIDVRGHPHLTLTVFSSLLPHPLELPTDLRQASQQLTHRAADVSLWLLAKEAERDVAREGGDGDGAGERWRRGDRGGGVGDGMLGKCRGERYKGGRRCRRLRA